MKFKQYTLILALVFFAQTSFVARAMTDEEIRTLGQTANAPAQVKAHTEGPGLGDMIGRLTFSLGVVLALMGGAVWAARRWLPQSVRNTRGGPIEILGTRALGRQKNLLLVKALDKTLLLGVTGQTIQCLAELDQEGTTWQEATMKMMTDE